ncbi:MAG: RES family NAD+ phosphorylase [Gemmatimonadota bacterium]
MKLRVLRHVRPDLDPLSAEGSVRYGGRWNPRGGYGALYTSLSREALRAEMERQLTRAAVPRAAFFPRRVVELEVELGRWVDLTDAAERGRRGVSLEGLVADDLSATRRLADKLRAEGAQAVLFPSAAGVGEHLAIFPDLLPAGAIRKLGEEVWIG